MFPIYLNAWIIQDGNYLDFSVGQEAEFALEFWFQQDVKVAKNANRSMEFLQDYTYRVTAEVVAIEPDLWIIDFGLLAYQLQPPPAHVKLGDYVTGEVGIGIDYYPYFESMSKDDRYPAMIYSWVIQQILQQTAPYIKQTHEGPGIFQGKEVLARDPAKLGYVSINRTDAWKDDKGVAEYILVCEKLDLQAKRSSRTATP